MDGSKDGRLVFARAKKCEIPKLVRIYNSVWGDKLAISAPHLRAQIDNFPQGQIVGHQGSEPVTLISTFPIGFEPVSPFDGFDYDCLTTNRTFANHLSIEDFDSNKKCGKIPALICASITTRSDLLRSGYASETLKAVLGFASELGIPALPFSAPRSFFKVRLFLPKLEIQKYLHLSVCASASLTYASYCARLDRLSEFDHIRRAFVSAAFPTGKIVPISQETFEEYSQFGRRTIAFEDPDRTAFLDFSSKFSSAFKSAYGRVLCFEDFLLLTGRRAFDSVMDMHIQHGARFIRKNGSIVTLENSRPLDLDSCGYNVPLVYGFDANFGH